MASEKEGLSTAESLRKTRTYGQVRCHNPSCMGRLKPKPGEPTVKCPVCVWNIASPGSKTVFPASGVRYGM